MLNIRPFENTDEDFAALVAINEILEPEERLTVPILRKSDEEFIAQFGLLRRYIVEFDGRVAGSGLYFPSEDNIETLMFSMHIHPDFQASEVQQKMQDLLLAQMRSHQHLRVASQPKENQQYRIRLLEAADFELKMRFLRSQLDVTTFASQKYEPILKRLEESGIELVTLADVMLSDPDWQHTIWRLFTQIEVDLPSPHPVDQTTFEEYAKYYEGDFFRPDFWAIAREIKTSGMANYVGMCVVNIMDSRPDTLFAGITGTIRSHRRLKIATALKVKNILHVQQQGYRFIYTNNEENNPMYELNKQLGFQPLPAWLYFEKMAA